MNDKLQGTKIRVLLADDHPMLRSGFLSSLADYPAIDVIGATGNIEEVLDLFRQLTPDVTVLDIMFGGKKTGLCVMRSLIESSSEARIVVLSQFDEDTLVRQAYRFGAMAFITKDADVEDLVKAIRKAYRGERHFLPKIAERLADMATRPAAPSGDTLSQRESDVLVLISQGKTIRDIATELQTSPRTVSDTITHLKTKFGVTRHKDLIPIGHDYGVQRD